MFKELWEAFTMSLGFAAFAAGVTLLLVIVFTFLANLM
jgi:hypothetical protein